MISLKLFQLALYKLFSLHSELNIYAGKLLSDWFEANEAIIYRSRFFRFLFFDIFYIVSTTKHSTSITNTRLSNKRLSYRLKVFLFSLLNEKNEKKQTLDSF